MTPPAFVRRYRYLLASSTLALVLGAPIALRQVSHRYEPYPAALLPAGGNVVKLSEGRLHYTRTSFAIRVDPSMEWSSVAGGELLHPLSGPFADVVARRWLGLPAAAFRHCSGLRAEDCKGETDEASEEVSAWLRARLAARGLPHGELLLLREEFAVAQGSGEVLDIDTTDVRLLRLH